MNSTIAAPPQQAKPRYGCFAAKIGAMFAHRLEQALKLASGRTLGAGQVIHNTVVDESRHPEADPHKTWRCLHPLCVGKKWSTKKELVAAHPPNRELERNEEAHCYLAVAYVPGAEGKPEKLDKHQNVIEEAIPARAPGVLLLSDEE